MSILAEAIQASKSPDELVTRQGEEIMMWSKEAFEKVDHLVAVMEKGRLEFYGGCDGTYWGLSQFFGLEPEGCVIRIKGMTERPRHYFKRNP